MKNIVLLLALALSISGCASSKKADASPAQASVAAPGGFLPQIVDPNYQLQIKDGSGNPMFGIDLKSGQLAYAPGVSPEQALVQFIRVMGVGGCQFQDHVQSLAAKEAGLKLEPQKADKKPGAKKSEPKKAEPKKDEPKKAEKPAAAPPASDVK